MLYKQKYLKYKNKYIDLKKQLGGSEANIPPVKGLNSNAPEYKPKATSSQVKGLNREASAFEPRVSTLEAASSQLKGLNSKASEFKPQQLRTPSINPYSMMDEQLSLEQVLKGMTIWAAFAAFEENKRGTITKGKEATFFIVQRPIKNETMFTPNFAHKTYILGKMVYSDDEL